MKLSQFFYKFLLRLILFAFCFIVITVVDPQHFNIIPDGFGKTHFIQGLTQYPQEKKQHITPTSAGTSEVLFCPSSNVCKKLCELIQDEKQKIVVAIYTITDKQIANMLVEAHKKGVYIEVITDRSAPLDRYSKIGMLHMHNIPVFLYQPPLENETQKGLMHNKFALFFNNKNSKSYIWHGSFNFTASGYRHNCESILIMEDQILFKQFLQEFERIKKSSSRYFPQKGTR